VIAVYGADYKALANRGLLGADTLLDKSKLRVTDLKDTLHNVAFS